MSRLLSRAQQWRLTWSLSTRFSSGISHSKTLRMAFDEREKREKERAGKHKMVKKLARDVEILTCRSSANSAGICDVYLVGAHHFSQKSSKEVGEIIRFLKPEVFFLELCSSSQSMLATTTIQMPTDEEFESEYMKSKPNITALVWKRFYASIYKMLGYLPGSDFRVAYEEANKYGGRVQLGDRPLEVRRFFEFLSYNKKF